MEKCDLDYIASYAHKLNDSKGNLEALTTDELTHFETLLRKFKIERRLDLLEEKIGQGRLI